MSAFQRMRRAGLLTAASNRSLRKLAQAGVMSCTMALGWTAPLHAQGLEDLPDRPIARTEVIAVIERQFAAMDANHDGIVTEAEFVAYRRRQDRLPEARRSELAAFERVGPGWFEHADLAGDGRVTLREAEERPLRLFDLADTNGDGVVSVRERQLAAMLMALGGGR